MDITLAPALKVLNVNYATNSTRNLYVYIEYYEYYNKLRCIMAGTLLPHYPSCSRHALAMLACCYNRNNNTSPPDRNSDACWPFPKRRWNFFQLAGSHDHSRKFFKISNVFEMRLKKHRAWDDLSTSTSH